MTQCALGEVPHFIRNDIINKKPCAIARMAEITNPASDPRSLRRHYPHQVQGVSTPAVAGPDSQPLRLPRTLLLRQNRTRNCEVNGSDRCVARERRCSRHGCHYSGHPIGDAAPVAKLLTRFYPAGCVADSSFMSE